jgi:hypothetical protein
MMHGQKTIKSVHVSGDCVPIIRRNSCVYSTLGACHFVWMTVWYAGWNSTLHTVQSSMNTVISPDDGHTVARNM